MKTFLLILKNSFFLRGSKDLFFLTLLLGLFFLTLLLGLFFLTPNANGFSGTPTTTHKKETSLETVTSENENKGEGEIKTDCPRVFHTSGTKFKDLLKDYSKFTCFPVLTTETLIDKHPSKTWVMEALSKEIFKVVLSPQEEFKLRTYLYPFIKNKNLKEKNLLDQINLKNKLGLDNSEEQQNLYAQFPSHDPKRIKNPDLKVVKDLKRRGMNTQALMALKRLKRSLKRSLKRGLKRKDRQHQDKIHKQLISVQKNIKRDETFLLFSQQYTDIVYNRYKKNKRHKRKRRNYLKHGLLNIRRIWTYKSTDEALRRLHTLIKYHCGFKLECVEHYWVLGRIYEEKSKYPEARRWYTKAIGMASPKSPEYINKLWSLVWLESKFISDDQALATAKTYIKKLPKKEVSSKLYYWMSRWVKNDSEKLKYKDLIKTHHPLSFYLWSPLALGEGIKLTKKKPPRVNAKNRFEKELQALTDTNFMNLTRTYIRFSEKEKNFKKTMTWKKLKALNGMYSDLLLDIEAKNINPKTHMVYLFSTKYNSIIKKKAATNGIPKELVWSVIRQESNFNPFARSQADAFGLMQILKKKALSYLKRKQVKRKQNLSKHNLSKHNLSPPNDLNSNDLNSNNLNSNDLNSNDLNSNNLSPIELFDPSFNISVGTWLLKDNLQKFQGHLPLAIAAYNANTKKARQWEHHFYKGDFLPMVEEITYRETRKYVKFVLRNIEIYSQLSN